jgi:CDP-diacylglycerol--serine O-phosphatidyltransferase
MASIVWLAEDFHIASDLLTYPVAVLTLTIGLLMVSNMRYHSFKEIDFKGRVPFLTIVAGMLVFVTIFLQPPVVLFSGFSLYVLSGLVLTLLQMRRARQERRFDKSD